MSKCFGPHYCLGNPRRYINQLICVLLFSISVLCESVGAKSPSTRADWMFEGKVGLSTHYFPTKAEEIEVVTNTFQVDKVAEQIQASGASWFILTTHHQPWLMMAPNQTYDRLLGHSRYTSERDLPKEMAEALSEKGIRLLLYVNLRLDPESACMNVDSKIPEAMGGWPPTDRTITNVAAVYREWSLLYGDKVAGWWIDGTWMEEYKNAKQREKWFKLIAVALRAGNPMAALAFNPGHDRFIRYTQQNDYLAGESNVTTAFPQSGRWQEGAQWHWWSFAGNWWGGSGRRFNDELIVEYTKKVVYKGGALTFDLGTLGILKPERNKNGIKKNTLAKDIKTGEHFGYISPRQIEQIKLITMALKLTDDQSGSDH